MDKGKTYVKNAPVLINAGSILYEGGGKTLDKLFDLVYPVGSVYISVNATSPATLFGGSWTQITGRFLYCTTTSKKTGGRDNHSHTLNNAYAKYGCDSWSYSKQKETEFWLANKVSTNNTILNAADSPNYGAELGGTTDSASNLPPYFTVYCWYRTA